MIDLRKDLLLANPLNFPLVTRTTVLLAHNPAKVKTIHILNEYVKVLAIFSLTRLVVLTTKIPSEMEVAPPHNSFNS